MAMGFTGTTELAYPAMLQLDRALETHPGMIERRFDVTQVCSLFEDILNQMVSLASSAIQESLDQSLTDTTFLLGGFSWKMGEFRIWEFAWDRSQRKYRKNRRRLVGARKNEHTFVFLGNGAKAAKKRLLSVLTDDYSRPATRGLDMEPLAVLAEAIADASLTHVGGAPQVIKVYRHMNAEPFSVLWPRTNPRPTFAGRPLLSYEKPFAPPLSLETPELNYKHLKGARAKNSALGAARFHE